MATTEDEIRDVERRISEEAFGEGNLDLLDEYVAEEYVGHNPGAQEDIHGREELKEFVTTFRSAFPDLDVTVEDQIVEGDRVVQRNRLTGTHEGELMGIPPTGESVEITAIGITAWEDGKGVEHWAQVDMMGLMEQLGVVEPAGE